MCDARVIFFLEKGAIISLIFEISLHLFCSVNHRSKFDHREEFSTPSDTSTDIKGKSRRFEYDEEAETYPDRQEEYEKKNSQEKIKCSFYDTAPCCDTYSTNLHEWYTPDKINVSIVFVCLVEIADIAIGDAIDLTVFKEYFFEFIGEIVRQDNYLVNIFFGDDISM